MSFNFNRGKSILFFIFLVGLYFVLYNYNELKNSKNTTGVVYEKFFINNYTNQQAEQTYLNNSKVYYILLYYTTNSTPKAAMVQSEEVFKKGDSIPIRYYSNNKKEIIYTFWSYWFTSIVVSFIAILIAIAFSISFIDANETVILYLGKGKLYFNKKYNNEQYNKKIN